MTSVKDPFSYSARWDSIGLDCSNCSHFQGPSEWPDRDGVIRCRLHDLSLRIQLLKSGYKEGEWFCRDFSDAGTAHAAALSELNQIRDQLTPGVLYRGNSPDGFLLETPFSELRADAT